MCRSLVRSKDSSCPFHAAESLRRNLALEKARTQKNFEGVSSSTSQNSTHSYIPTLSPLRRAGTGVWVGSVGNRNASRHTPQPVIPAVWWMQINDQTPMEKQIRSGL